MYTQSIHKTDTRKSSARYDLGKFVYILLAAKFAYYPSDILEYLANFPLCTGCVWIVSAWLPGCEVVTAQSRSHCASCAGLGAPSLRHTGPVNLTRILTPAPHYLRGGLWSDNITTPPHS